MKRIFSIALLFCICVSVFADDIIITKQGVKIRVKIVEVSLTDIKYKKADNLEGPTYTMAKNDINTILYENDSVDIFNEELDRNQYNPIRGNIHNIPQINRYGKTIYCDGNIIQTNEYLRLAKQFSPLSFNSYIKGRRLMNAGWCLLSVGLAFEFIGGMLCLYDGWGAGLAFLSIGNASFVTSIPLLCVGVLRKRDSINNFGSGMGRSYGMNLNLGVTSTGGLGLAFQF